MNKERDLTKKEIKKIYNNGESIMKNKICKCGHEDGMHSRTKGCLYVLHRYPNLKFDDYCPCKKFESVEVCEYCGENMENDPDYHISKYCKPKNHSPSEDGSLKRQLETSGGDSPTDQDVISLEKEHVPEAVGRRGTLSEHEDTLSSKMDKLFQLYFSTKMQPNLFIQELKSLCKDFIKKLKEGDKTFIQHIQNHLKEDEKVVCRICNKTAEEIVGNYTNLNELAGAELI